MGRGEFFKKNEIMADKEQVTSDQIGQSLDTHQQKFVNSIEGFYERYLQNIQRYSSNSDAYEATERQYKQIMGQNRYKTYSSFKASLSQHQRRKS